MLNYLLRRLFIMVPTLIIISAICFTVITLPPGDIITQYENRLILEIGMNLEEAEQIGDALRHRYGLDKSVIVQYFIWLFRAFQGDLGISLGDFTDVSDLVMERLGYTIIITTTTLFFSWIVGILIGIYSATHRYSVTDYFFNFCGIIGLSIPNFFLALVAMVIMVFVFNLPVPTGLFSSQAVYDAPWSVSKFVDMLKHLWLPVLVMGTAGTASILRIMRTNLLDELGQLYIQATRAKGLSEKVTIYKHAVRNAINPLISILGLQIPMILSAGAITSIVLGLPTIGPLLLQALKGQDLYVAASILMFYALLLLIGNFLADILLAIADPRIRYE